MSRCSCESGTAACACKIVAADTNCIDMSVAGIGTLASPYTISAVPIVDPVTGNQLSCGAAGLLVPAAASGPVLAVPFTSGASGSAAWTTDRAAFTLVESLAGSYRWLHFVISVSSGNIQVGVVKLDATNPLNYTRVMNSGIIPCPAAATIRLDLGTAVLSGSHALFFWADNSTVAVPWSGLVAPGSFGLAKVDSLVAGVPASGSVTSWIAQEQLNTMMLETG